MGASSDLDCKAPNVTLAGVAATRRRIVSLERRPQERTRGDTDEIRPEPERTANIGGLVDVNAKGQPVRFYPDGVEPVKEQHDHSRVAVDELDPWTTIAPRLGLGALGPIRNHPGDEEFPIAQPSDLGARFRFHAFLFCDPSRPDGFRPPTHAIRSRLAQDLLLLGGQGDILQPVRQRALGHAEDLHDLAVRPCLLVAAPPRARGPDRGTRNARPRPEAPRCHAATTTACRCPSSPARARSRRVSHLGVASRARVRASLHDLRKAYIDLRRRVRQSDLDARTVRQRRHHLDPRERGRRARGHILRVLLVARETDPGRSAAGYDRGERAGVHQ